MGEAADWLNQRRGSPDALAGATPFLALAGEVVGGWLLAKGALAAAEGRAGDQAPLRISLAAHFARTVLSQAPGRIAEVTQGADLLSKVAAADLAA